MTETLHSLFAESVANFRDHTAVVYDDNSHVTTLTYGELQQLAEIVSTRLQQAQTQGQFIGVSLPLCTQLPGVILGVLSASYGFVYIDANSPSRHLTHLVQELHLQFLIVDELSCSSLLEKLSRHGCSVNQNLIQYGETSLVLVELSSTVSSNQVNSGCLAYAITTSGTTGSPKIVFVPHSCIVPNILDLRSRFRITADDLVLVASPLTFDPSIVELFTALGSGASVLMVPPFVKQSPTLLMDMITVRHTVTVIQATPTLIRRFADVLLRSSLLSKHSKIRILALGGEQCPHLGELRTWREAGNECELYNIYGITEVSCWTSIQRIPHEVLDSSTDGQVPLGQAMLATELEVRDEAGQAVTEGPGQLYVGGKDRVCVIDNSVNGSCLRATGDWVTVAVDGAIYFAGRRDNQVKRHGKRINITSLEIQVTEHLPDVAAACAVFTPGPQPTLQLFVVPRCRDDGCQRTTTPADVRRKLQASLRSHEVPDAIHVVVRLPMTAHGKVDRDRLLLMTAHGKVDRDGQLSMTAHGKVDRDGQLPMTAHGKVDRDGLLPMTAHGKVDRDGQLSMTAHGKVDRDGQLSMTAHGKVDRDGLLPMTAHGKVDRDGQLSMTAHGKVDRDGLLSMTAHDKVDRDGLLAADTQDDGEPSESAGIQIRSEDRSRDKKLATDPSRAAPVGLDRAATAALLRELWASHLGLSPVVAATAEFGDTFLRHGGDSLSAVRLAGELERRLLASPPPTLYDRILSSTFPELCDYLVCVSSSGRSPHADKPPPGDVAAGDDPQERSEADDRCPAKRARLLAGDSLPGDLCESVTGKGRYVSSCQRTEIIDMCAVAGVGGEKALLRYAGGSVFKPRWKYDTGKCVDASPLVAVDGYGNFCPCEDCLSGHSQHVVFLGSHSGRMAAIALSSGEMLWDIHLPDRIESSACLSACGNFVIVGCYDYCVYVICADSGRVAWVFETKGEVKSSPCTDLVTGIVYVGSHDQHLYALDIQTQQCTWRKHLKGGSLFSSPCASRNPHTVYAATLAGLLTALHSDTGRLIWTYRCGKPLFSSPQLVEGGVCIGCVDGVIYCISQSGNLMWNFKTDGYVFSSICTFPLITTSETAILQKPNQIVAFGCHDNHVYCLSSSNGKLNWKVCLDSEVYSSPFIASAHVIANAKESVSVNAIVFVASTRGTLYMLDAETGNILTHYLLPYKVFSSPVALGNAVVVGCRDNFVYCMELSP
ncbi:PREDICTED: acyl-CoA synthetase family member 4-like [Priapulus caudatus]|uniref:Acyl-CoA synthetase family member 4-like n=1 Tax=Priapulus caudatus TaxID=37621 RepID=A0ABM1DQ51_PRICU|nr:PREDICTED: acyl-CoA synthetase family member 4-like [Priapulus caudatus]